jgi:hypothetical protein
MRPGRIASRRFIFGISVLIALALLNVFLFVQARESGFFREKWSFVEKNNGMILLGRVELLEGGYLKISDVYELVYKPPKREQRSSEQFQLEAFGTGAVQVIEVATFDSAQIGPNDVRQWGAVPRGSRIEQRLEELDAEKSAP